MAQKKKRAKVRTSKKRPEGKKRGRKATRKVGAGVGTADKAVSFLRHRFHRFLGLSLSGGKSDKACLAVVDFYPDSHRVFLNRIFDRVRTEEFISADLKLHELILQFSEHCDALLMDVPLSLPKCHLCQLPCPGYETCNEPEIKYMRGLYQESSKKKPKKIFTPYTQRSVELFLQEEGQEGIEIQHTLGANLAPLVARARFIQRRLTHLQCLEVMPRLAVMKLGLELKVNRSQLKVYRNSIGGDEARKAFLQAMSDRWGIFFYEHDLKVMWENFHAFEAFICAFVGYLRRLNKNRERPRDFPKSESWPEIPQ